MKFRKINFDTRQINVDGEVAPDAKTITIKNTGEVLYINRDIINPEFIRQKKLLTIVLI